MNRKSSGMTLIEALVSIALLGIIGTVLVSTVTAAVSAVNSAKLKSIATRCAESRMEEIKAFEATYKREIQNGNWTNFLNSANEAATAVTCGAVAGKFTRTTTVAGSGTNRSVTVLLSWNEKGSKNVTITTYISQWTN